jgi:hypothetical protein
VPGVAIPGTIATQVFPGATGGQQGPAPARMVPGFHAAFLVGMVVCVIVVLISVSIRGKRADTGWERDYGSI